MTTLVSNALDTVQLNKLFHTELSFYEVLSIIAKRTKVFLTIPETFILGFGFTQPTLFCTDYETGELLIRENISTAGITEACNFFADLNKVKGGVPIAVHKLPATAYCKDICRPIFTIQEAALAWSMSTTQTRAQVLQRYIVGLTKRAVIIRATWDGNKVQKQVLTNPTLLRKSLKSFELDQERPKRRDREAMRSTFFVLPEQAMKSELMVAHVVDSKVLSLVTLLEKYYLPTADLKIHSLEADFVQDEKGLWYGIDSYLINLKSYTLSKHLGYAPEHPLRASQNKRRRILRPGSLPTETDTPASQSKLPKIKHWNKAIEKQKEIVTLMEARERAKHNKSALF